MKILHEALTFIKKQITSKNYNILVGRVFSTVDDQSHINRLFEIFFNPNGQIRVDRQLHFTEGVSVWSGTL